MRPLLPTSFSARPQGLWLALVAMVGAVALANHLAQKPLGPYLTWGTPAIATTFLINEVTHQLWGPRAARWVITRGFWAALAISLAISPARIAIASAAAYLSSQLLDIAVFARLRQVRRRWWWVAPASASTAASVLDTAIFFAIAFVGSEQSWWRLACGDFTMKLAVDLLMLLPFRLVLRQRLARRTDAWAPLGAR